MNTQYKSVNYRMIKEYIENSLNKQFSLKIIQRYGRQFRCDSKCSENNYYVFFRCIYFVSDVYLVHDCPISKDVVKFAFSFYEFGFQKKTSCSKEKCEILIGKSPLRFNVSRIDFHKGKIINRDV